MQENRTISRFPEEGQSIGTYLHCVFSDVAKHWPSLVMLTAAAVLLAIVVLSHLQEPVYKASVTVAVTCDSKDSSARIVSGEKYSENFTEAVNSAVRLRDIAASEELKTAAAKDLEEELGLEEFEGTATIYRISNMVEITVKASSPYVSYREAEAILQNLEKYSQDLDGGVKLSTLESLRISEVPENLAENVINALLFGAAVFVIACAVLIYLSLTRDTVRSGYDVKHKTGMRLLGTIVREKDHGKGRKNTGDKKADCPLTIPIQSSNSAEGVRKLAARLLGEMEVKKHRTLLVASATENEGKSDVAARIALAMAQINKKVLLIDMDFHNPSIYKILNMQDEDFVDLSSYLEKYGQEGLQEIQDHRLELVTKVPGTPLSAVLTEKPSLQAMGKYADAIKLLIDGFAGDADYIVIDSSPVSLDPLTEELAMMTDDSVIVVRQHTAEAREINETVHALGGRKHVLGCVLNDSWKEYINETYSGRRSVNDGSAENPADHKAWKETEEVIEINLYRLVKDILDGFRKRGIRYLALVGVVGTLCFLVSSLLYKPLYQATATFTVNYISSDQRTHAKTQLNSSFPGILTSHALKNIVSEEMGYYENEELPVALWVSEVKNSNLMTLKAQSEDPQIAYDTLRSVLRHYPFISERVIGVVSLNQIDESGVPEEPSNTPGKLKTTVLGMLACLIVCIAGLGYQSIIKKTIHSQKELAHYFNVECLGNLPFAEVTGNGIPVIDSEGISPEFTEAAFGIRHRVEAKAQKRAARTILVTSALQSEGKTTTAVNLALAMAEHRHRVLLIDADLQNPSVLQALSLEPAQFGAADLLSGNCEPAQAIIPYKNGGNLSVLGCGAQISDPEYLWSDAGTGDSLRKLREKYDYIFIDTRPNTITSDASLIARYTDACLYVVGLDSTGADALREGMEMIAETNCKLLGCVLDHTKRETV